MGTLQVLRERLTAAELLKGLGIAVLLGRFLPTTLARQRKGSLTWNSSIVLDVVTATGFFFLFLVARSWLALVDHHVPEPYLDEFFHIPQAQTYCEGRYWDWDDKITTPPGLYLLSVAYHKFWMVTECTALTLRSNNLLATLLTALVAARCRTLIATRSAEQDGWPTSQSLSYYSYHTAINIALFPVVFFFSALYYTDIFSTLFVLLAYQNHLLRVGWDSPTFLNDVWTIVLGASGLFMRQTNVFWIVVYMGGLEAVHVVRSLKPAPADLSVRQPTFAGYIRYYAWRSSVGDVHDPSLNLSWPHDWLFSLTSIAIAAISNPSKVLRQVWPHIAVLGLFAGFVAWNGGVVLGDKSNHVATIHLAQMLYIWPFFAFFSAPLLIPSALPLLEAPLRLISKSTGKEPSEPTLTRPVLQRPEKPLTLRLTDLLFVKKIYYIPYILGTVLLSLAVVKFNTIIHPFTLADNRHYMFYVFRHTILRSPNLRYLLVAAYTASRWLVWAALAGSSPTPAKQTNLPPQILPPTARLRKHPPPSKTKTTVTTTPPTPSTSPPPTSTALLWLLATSLSLMTAPLVEPRYFILPWVFWRLLVPAWRPAAAAGQGRPGLGRVYAQLGQKIDVRLGLETVWFLAINLGTMYMFLFRPFYWRGPDGEVADGGRVQRFMW
ncbi:glycosyltransferase family 59 protein [Lasiosphaeria hispida]|uniref:Dol-P-Glc:Glc(2)Man(9)GlcNAc(2)-PP-Dol alpha-1,2-glucosyltransferase n=1 Tax=Lasiosphaeria hispida TaxID=260671 RepID=A0AAJ0HH17_9PEZI|nr:glycosyltransferase family 59 protein [Lasiosphaeria hispida]